MNKPTPKKNERGAAAVEFALVLPLLLLLIFGGIEFGLVMFNKQVLTNASREAVRAGIVVGPGGERVPGNDIIDVALTYCADFLVTFDPARLPPTVTVTYEDEPGKEFGTDLTVLVNYKYEFLLLPNLRNLFGGSADADLTLEARTIMRYE